MLGTGKLSDRGGKVKVTAFGGGRLNVEASLVLLRRMVAMLNDMMPVWLKIGVFTSDIQVV
jgi:hypothetical protein